MLVLKRKTGERIWLDARIEITVLEVQGASVRIGIDAPKEIHIQRGEIINRAVRCRATTPTPASQPLPEANLGTPLTDTPDAA